MLIWIGLLLPGLGAVAALVLTQTVAAKWLLLPRLQRVLDLDIQAEGLRISPSGVLVLSGVTCRVPGMAGPGGQVLRARRVMADVNWRAAAKGQAEIRAIRVVGGVVRLSQSVETGEINIGGVPVSGGVGAAARLPIVYTTDVLVELGEHRRDAFTALKVVHLRADLSLGPDSNSYLVSLQEMAGAGSGLELRGITGESGTHLELSGLSLSAWPLRTFPRGVRDFAEELALEGEVPEARLRAWDREFRLDVQLAGVSLNLPWILERPGDPPMRLKGVDGMLTFRPRGVGASLSGSLEDLPCAVTLEYDGFNESSPFRGRIECSEYVVGEKPALLPYLPATVQKQFRRFSGPQAVVSATVNVWRAQGEGGAEADVSYEGRVRFREGVASLDKFPYEFRGLNGVARFDNRAITIERVQGRAKTGAVLSATGHITPPDGSGLAEIVVNVSDVPVDEALAAGMGESRATILDALFSRPHYESLVQRSLITREPDPSAGSPPHFALAGTGSVRVIVRHGYDGVGDWKTGVRVHFPRVGVLPREFPFPMIGRNVTITIDDDAAKIDGAVLHGVAGGTARVDADVALSAPDGSPGLIPRLRIAAEGVPVSPLLLSAIPDADLAAGDGRGVRAAMSDLRPEGVLEAAVTVSPREGESIGFDARVACPDLTLRPISASGEGGGLEAKVRGILRMNETNLHAEADGVVNALPVGEQSPPRPAVQSVRVVFDAPLGSDEGVKVALDAVGVDLHAPLEDAVRAVHPASAEWMLSLRMERRPEGVVSAALRVNPGEGGGGLAVTVLETRALSFAALGGRVSLGDSSGTVSVHTGEQAGTTRIVFDDSKAAVAFNGEPAGMARLHGAIVVNSDGSLNDASDAAGALEGGSLESAMTHAAIRHAAGEEGTAIWREANPVGQYSLRLALGSETDGPAESGQTPFTLTVLPGTLSLSSRGRRIEAASVGGEVQLSPGAGRVRGFEATGTGWTLRGEGDWSVAPGGDLSLLADFALAADSLTPDVKAMMPAELAAALDRIGLSVEGPFTLSEARVRGLRSASGERSGSFNGNLGFARTSLDPGVKISDAAGKAAVSATLGSGDTRPWYSIGLELASTRAMGLRLGESRASVEGTPEGVVHVAVESAECHGGRIVAGAEVRLGESSEPETYRTELTMADVRFGPVHADLFARTEESGAGARPEVAERPDDSRGALNAGLTLAGEVGVPASRRGRGHATISGEDAEVLRLPLVLQLIEASNLALPTGSRLEFARADFFVEGDTIAFSDLSVESDAVWIHGYGTMDWSDLLLDLRFTTGSARRIPIVSAVVEGLRREIVSTTVTGPLRDPKIAIGPFAGTGRWLREALGQGDPQRRRRMGMLSEGSPRRPRAAEVDTIPPAPSPWVLPDSGFAGAGSDGAVDDAIDAWPPPREKP